MYICEECGQAFEEPKKTVFRGMKEYGVAIEPDETEYTCPHCGSEYYEEARVCPMCGEYYAGSEDVCDECMDRLEKEAAPFIRARAEEKAGFIADMAKGNEAAEKILEELIA